MLVFTDVLMTDGAVPYFIVSSAGCIGNAAISFGKMLKVEYLRLSLSKLKVRIYA
jgi:hypothetical protein